MGCARSLTKWMFALNRMSLARGVPHYNHLALQLAKGARFLRISLLLIL